MSDLPSFSRDDIRYAAEMTRVVYEPDRRIDTFGDTRFNFLLLSELMDEVNVVRVRSGWVEAEKPKIIRPSIYNEISTEGFSGEAKRFFDWLSKNGPGFLTLLEYGFRFKRSEVSEEILHEPLDSVRGRLLDQVRNGEDGVSLDKIRPVVKADFLFRHVHHHVKIQGPVLEHISCVKSGNIHQTVQMNHHGLGATQLPDHAYPGISLPHGIFFHVRPIGIQQLADAQPPDEFLRLFPHHAALFRQGLQQFQSFRQAAAVHQAAGLCKGLRTARPEGIIFSVRQNSLGTESRRQKAKEDLCA